MKKLKYYVDEIIDVSVLETLAAQFFLSYENEFDRIPSEVRIKFIKSLTHMYENERKELVKQNLKYNQLVRSIRKAQSIGTLARIHHNLNETTAEIFLKTGSVGEVHQRCTAYRDKLTLKIISLTKKELESTFAKPSNTFAWIRMGSTGRDEQTLYTDQDNLLVYKNKADKEYYKAFAQRMVTNLAAVGFAKCKGQIMPTNEKWFGTLDEWENKLHDFMGGSENLVDLIVLTDAKYAGGNYPLAHAFIEEARKVLKTYHASFKAIAKATVLMPIALTIFRNFKTEKKGEFKDMMNIKFQGWMPLIMITLLFSLENNIWETNTINRIKLLERANVFEPSFAEDLLESYYILTGSKLLVQIEFLKGNMQNLSYYINPFKLDKEARKELRWALSIVEKFQRLAASSYNISEDAF